MTAIRAVSPPDDGDDPRRETAAEQGHRLIRDRLLDARTFLDDWGQAAEPVWGEGSATLWAAGEALTIAGSQGTGKTTLAGQLVHARAGLSDAVLGMPVEPGQRRVLYLAMDRPRQTARALRRTFGGDRPTCMSFWPGPPLADFAKSPGLLLAMAQAADADTVVVDSIKDAAVGLTDDEVGAGYNRARQTLIVEGVQLLELHHLIKRTANGGTPRELADVYGSVWVTAGTGSVLLLDGKAGDPVVTMRHLKQPVDEVGPLQVLHDNTTGWSSVVDRIDLVEVAARRGSVTVADVAAVLGGGRVVDRNETEKARRQLESLVRAGRLDRVDALPGHPVTYLATGP